MPSATGSYGKQADKMRVILRFLKFAIDQII